MSDVSLLAELLGHVCYHFDRIKPLLPTYGHLLVASVFPIWIGAHSSLSRPSSAAKPPKKISDNDDDDSDIDEDNQGPVKKMEGLQPSDALMFPLTAGATLGGLYMVIKWLEDPAILNKILSFYFSQMGLFFAIAFLKDTLLVLRSIFFPMYYRSGGKMWHAKQSERIFVSQKTGQSEGTHIRRSPLPGMLGAIPFPKTFLAFMWTCRNASYQRLRLRFYIRGLFDKKPLVGLLDLLSGIFALVTVGYFAFVAKPWWLTNFLGFSFSYGALQFMSPSTFWTGSLVLGSLFFYDIYFVFFTPLMVTVATKLDVPIKLLFPRPASPGEEASGLAMLGLGDIVIPGMMVGLALRFDLFLYYHKKGIQKARGEGSNEVAVKPQYQRVTGSWGERFWAPTVRPQYPEFQPPYSDARSFPKPYFKASIVGYVVGMVTTLLAMQYSNHAQPALLYLVPGVLISLWGTAFFRGEIRSMWDFSDAEEEEEEEAGDKVKGSTGELMADKEETEQGVLGLFSKMLFGESKLSTSKSDSSKKEKTKEDVDSKTASTEKSQSLDLFKTKVSKEQDDLTLVSFSVSLRRKPLEKEEPEIVTFPKFIDGDEEPPLKRRRGSPQKSSA
ncbi:hypothetical protein N7495_007471 [Penicillium taxi]|uniref:uncharacterized protein n=1 Tax=Penicillium taxi TaxID=168475 RepID=UPI00254519B9|nr:uncharacterized protein N7495_007471 [Penicillium taxi]KAJ5887430.1 hypothetical protein N7495_007471 [Penicillium taxi]